MSAEEAGDQGSGRGRPAERQAAIAEYVMLHGSASAHDLAVMFDVSTMTMHRDLDELERQGVVRKYRGGASAQPTSVFESNVAYRMRVARTEKDALARHARRLIEPGMSVMLDDSTSALAVAQLLHDATPLTVVTNFLEAIKAIAPIRDISLIALGGEYHPTHDSFLGIPCIEAVESLRVDLLITSTSAISDTHAFHQEQEIVLVKWAMMRSAQRRVLLVDHSKLGRRGLHRVAPLTDFDHVVVDAKVPQERLRALRENQVRCEVAV